MASISDRLTATSFLRAKLSARGMGVYFHVVALIEQSPTRSIPRDLDLISLVVLEDAEIVRQVLEDFGLFRLSATTIQDALDPGTIALEPLARSSGLPVKSEDRRASNAAPVPAPRRRPTESSAQIASKPVRTEDRASAPEQKIAIPRRPIETQPERDPTSQLYDDVRAAWNERFSGTRRVVTSEVPDAVVWNNFCASARTYEFADFVSAFRIASTAKFNWQFKDAIKPDNMQRILSSAEPPKELSFEEKYFGGTEDMPDYAREFVNNMKQKYLETKHDE